MHTQPHRDHGWYEARLEGYRRNELDDAERADVASHAAGCEQCAAWLSSADREDAIMQTMAGDVIANFDFDRARRGTENLIAVRRRQTWVLLTAVAVYCAVGVGIVSLRSPHRVWISAGAVLVLMGPPLGLLLLKDRVAAARARASLATGRIAISARRFESRVRVALALFQLNRAVIALLTALWGVLAFSAASGRGSLPGLVMLGILAALAPWLWRRWLAPSAVKREEELVRGRITLAEYRAAIALWPRRGEARR